ncbi:mechanosensitive ion channel family protein [Parasphingorhabdus flavimaris]|uniref:Small-conductance mechanosensitive channel n=1 Tax=Parasphingorhabdus flavimaris TaxID=266812 RepID=A0ABX2N3L7_9SPHN|nr:mechanosensitive ion channel [Parasphingorhabdus flavimaris]NVD28272.1 mechanosensitive ion channel [Parasphingorhabdus flavimaris]|tara:strand:- start:25775 stop:26659 length:885 start_codon:yes stop_codon:yes gene_type:complete
MDEQVDKSLNTLEILIAQLQSMWTGIVGLLPSLVIAIAFLIFTWLVAKFATKISDKITAKTSMRPSLRELVDTLVKIGIWTIGLLISLTILLPDLTPGSLVAGLGIGTVAIGFAFQDIFENFLAGILIMAREKMRIGDYIKCDGIEGKVEQILLRETHIRKPSNELTIVPNSILFKNPVEILTDQQQRRHEIVVGVSYDTDLEAARTVISDAVKSTDIVDSAKPIDILACEFNSSSVDFKLRWWSGSAQRDMHESRDVVIRSVKRALDDAGIEIPFPYMTHTFKESLAIASTED